MSHDARMSHDTYSSRNVVMLHSQHFLMKQFVTSNYGLLAPRHKQMHRQDLLKYCYAHKL